MLSSIIISNRNDHGTRKVLQQGKKIILVNWIQVWYKTHRISLIADIVNQIKYFSTVHIDPTFSCIGQSISFLLSCNEAQASILVNGRFWLNRANVWEAGPPAVEQIRVTRNQLEPWCQSDVSAVQQGLHAIAIDVLHGHDFVRVEIQVHVFLESESEFKHNNR